jgi:hypothetical protein
MATGKSLGFKIGDLVFTGAFAGIIISDAHTSTPCCEVFGFEQECGSAYATDLKKLTVAQFVDLAKASGHTEPFRVYGDASYSALMAAGLQVEKAC